MGSHTDELVHWGRPARMDRTDDRLLGREREAQRLDGLLGDPDGPRLVLVRGEHGVGRRAFLRTAGERLRASGGAVYAVDCVPGDADRPLLLALRLVMALRERRPAGDRAATEVLSAVDRGDRAATEALSAVDRGDLAAMEALLRAVLARCAPVTVLVDDAQYADQGSLSALSRIDVPGVRLVVSVACRDGAEPDKPAPADGDAPHHVLDTPSADAVVLGPLDPHDTDALVARWLQAEADTQLARQVRELTRGLPGAVEALLTAWTRQDVIRVADGHAFVPSRATVPVLPDDDRFLTALDRLGEPARTVAAALSILGPLGEPALHLTAQCTGLSPEAVDEGARRLAEAGIVDEAPGLPFRLPLTAHAVRERMSPVLRSRLSAAAVEVLWNGAGSPGDGTSAPHAEPGPPDGTASEPGLLRSGAGSASGDASAPHAEPGSPDGTAPEPGRFRSGAGSAPGDTPAPHAEPGLLRSDAASAPGDASAPHADPGPLDSTGTSTQRADADAPAYRADRIADAGSLVDRERAVAELTDAARQIRPGIDDGRVLRWLRAARDLTEHADARDLVLQQYGTTAYLACDYAAARAAAESLLRDPGPTLSDLDLQEAACLIVAVTANQRDWPTMSRLGTAHWWDVLPVPALARVTGRALALCHLSRWRQTEDLLRTTETVWNTGPRARAAPAVFLAMAELGVGRPEPYRRALAFDEAPQLPPGKVYSLAGGMVDNLLTRYDLAGVTTLLATTGLTVPVLPPLSRFLHHHLTGDWDQALESARRLLAGREIQSTPVADSALLPARTAAILLAQGRVTTALQLVRDADGEGAPPQCSLHATEAELLMALGDLAGAERTLRTGLDRTRAHDQTYGTDELWALLAQLTSRAGRDSEAVDCVRHLEDLVHRTGTDRTRLLHLLASARVQRDAAPGTAHRALREAVDLARERGLPFETATTLVTAATAGAVPAALLHEAYEVFGRTGAALWRFRTRTALREAGLTVPGRSRATAENDGLLTTLLTEQLTTRQIARVLHLTEDAVSRRLSRLFARTGKRSRTELVTASLTPTF
ncbi:AAA family ATPase [Streptomyces niveiscabiei]|uniref:AAA family ATPase n=1 Tax=Streptomyces niveiscabiei TaxID=164115 RepID=UPI0038F7FD8C